MMIKLNDYNRGNKAGDQVKVQLKYVKFNAKENAKEDKPFDDGLKKSERGTVVEMPDINSPLLRGRVYFVHHTCQ